VALRDALQRIGSVPGWRHGKPVELSGGSKRRGVDPRRATPPDLPGETGFNAGFSVNLPLAATQLERISEPELKEWFGDFKFRLAREREQIEREVSTNRVGHELFPLLIALVAVLLGLEHVLANRFYRQS
jgi:hypothetical protein